MRKLFILSFFFVFFIFFIVPKTYAARALTISANKSALFGSEELAITASASGFTNGETIYIKGAFYQDGTTNYFGYTKNGDNWVKNGESTTSQKQIKIGEWDNLSNVKVDFSDSGYKGEGSYKFKLGFYYLTSGGNLSSVNWSTNSVDVNISEPDPTSTPIPTLTTAPTPTKTPTPTPTKTPSVVPSKETSSTPTNKVQEKENNNDSLTESKKDNRPTPEVEVLGAQTSKTPILFIVLGLIFFIACGILAYFQFGDKLFIWKNKKI